MSRREYDRYDDRQSETYRRGGRNERDSEEVDYRRSRYEFDGPAPPQQRTQTQVKETDTVITQGNRTERGPRQPDFLREDYGRNDTSGQLVVRDDRREQDEYVSRSGGRSRGPPQNERVEKEDIVFRERERSRGPPYPRSDVGDNDIVFRERTRSRPPPAREEIDISIREKETDRRPPPRVYEPPPVEREEITYERSRSRQPPPRRDREEIDIDIDKREYRGGREVRREDIDIDIKERDGNRGREVRKEDIDIDIDIRNRGGPAPRPRSVSRGNLVRKDREEWVVRRQRTPSPSPSPPPRDYEKEQIIIRTRTPEPEPPPREPTPEPLPPPEPPVYRPPIIQEVITHHRHIDHGVERVRSPSPPPPPPPKKEEEDIDISIRRTGVRNGKPYKEDIDIDIDIKEREGQGREIDRRRSASARPNNIPGRVYEDNISNEAEYYNRRVGSRGYPGEAYNGATRNWGLMDLPPGTERVRMDGVGGGREEITWNKYDGNRHERFYTGDRVYDSGYGNGYPAPAPAPLSPPPREEYRDTRSTEVRIEKESRSGRTRDRRWTEVTKDLVIEEAIKEMGYEFEESDGYFYVMEYLRYVGLSISPGGVSDSAY